MSLLKDKIEIQIEETELNVQKTLQSLPKVVRWFTIIITLAIIPAYFISQNIAYKILLNRYNQNQALAKPSFTNPSQPKNSNVYLTTLGQNQYAAAVMLTNLNLDLSVKQLDYQFIFSNSKKQEVYRYNGKTYLLPNESKYVIVPTFTTNEQIIFADFVLPEKISWQKRIEIPKINLSTSLPKIGFELNPFNFYVEGNFVNNSNYELREAKITFVLFDQSGTIVGLSQRDEYTIKPNEQRSYKQLWPNMNPDNIDKVKVDVFTNPLNENNLKLSPYNPSPASDLSRPSSQRTY
jgi:hypothetical protein